MKEPFEHVIEALWDNGEFVLSRNVAEDARPTFLLTAPALARPRPETIRRLEHVYSLRDELDPAFAARPLSLTRHRGRPTLLLEDPGGEPLARLLGRPMEFAELLRVASGVAVALVDGEIARIEGRAVDAERLYERAIRLAREQAFLHKRAPRTRWPRGSTPPVASRRLPARTSATPGTATSAGGPRPR